MTRSCHRASTMSKAEIILIMMHFQNSYYRCLKYFYQEKVFRRIVKDAGALIISSSTIECNISILPLSKEAVYQCYEND